jgi:cell wall assembly regulator SMI1
VKFPADFRASLRVHDGQDNAPRVQLWPFALRLGSLDSLVRCWKDDRKYFDAKAMAEREE